MRISALSAAAAGAVLIAFPLVAHADPGASDGEPNTHGSFTYAVYGDSPYGTSNGDVSQTLATPAFIDAVNADPDVSAVVHVGDIHSGKQLCTEAYDRQIADMWTHFADPLVYTPGDNEWADCNKSKEGGGTPADYANGDPLANLALVRSIFFPNPGYTLGGRPKQVISQAQVGTGTDANYVENVMWEQSKVLFVTLNLPGGSNNDTDVWYGAPTETAAQAQEVSERTGADLRWLDTAFAMAKADGAEAVMIGSQADMWDPEKGPPHQAGHNPFVASIASHTTDFGRPVLMFNGDSHVYRSDNPLAPSDPLSFMHPGYDVPNFHRVVVHGSTFPLEYLRLTADP